MIQFQCPTCDKQLSVKDSRASSVVVCPGCKERFELDVSAEPPAADDYEVVDDDAEAAPARKQRGDDAAGLKTRKKKKKKKKKSDWPIPPVALAVMGLLVAVGLSSFVLYKAFMPGAQDTQADGTRTAGDGKSKAKDDDFAPDEMTAEERKYYEAGKPFVLAVAQNNLDAAYALLSAHAKQSMRRGQFGGARDENDKTADEEFKDVSAEQFGKLFKQVVKQFGTPRKIGALYVECTDPKILSGKAADNIERFDVMIAIGAMPASIPADIRKAALRGQIQTRHPKVKVEEEADEGPYFNVKYVLVEEAGQLKVGYFEFFPPSILD